MKLLFEVGDSETCSRSTGLFPGSYPLSHTEGGYLI